MWPVLAILRESAARRGGGVLAKPYNDDELVRVIRGLRGSKTPAVG